ncbi:MAG: hypothetical protein JWQ95_4424 [Sphaerisporangium sp.]|jgi:hypothetical protein|nr:hypothetical protein [Sphaerisporangium sp.]
MNEVTVHGGGHRAEAVLEEAAGLPASGMGAS